MGIFKGKRKKGVCLARIKPQTYRKRQACFVLTPLKSPPRKRFLQSTPIKSATPKPLCHWSSTKFMIVSTPKKGRKELKFHYRSKQEDNNTSIDFYDNCLQKKTKNAHDFESIENEEYASDVTDTTKVDRKYERDNNVKDIINTSEDVEHWPEDEFVNVTINTEQDIDNDTFEMFVEDEQLKGRDSLAEIIEMLPVVLEELSSVNQDATLLTFLKLVYQKKFPKENIAFTVWCDLVNWFNVQDTRQMRYSDNTMHFFWVGWKLFGGRFVRFMSGPKNETSFLQNKRLLDPLESKINFPCPSENVLRNLHPLEGILDREMDPGILDGMLKLKAEKDKNDKSYVIMFDGKKVRTGRDVDLLGFEKGPTLKDRESMRDAGLKTIEESMALFKSITTNVDDTGDEDRIRVYSALLNLLTLFSETLKKLRLLKKDKDVALVKLMEKAGNDWRGSKFVLAIDLCHTTLYRLTNAIEKTLCIIRAICKTGAYLNRVGFLFAKSTTVNLHTQSNVRFLRPPDEVKESLETTVIGGEITKQRSQEWFEERKTKKITGSTIYAALGCDTLKRQREHFDKVISGVEPPEPTPEQKSAMQRGTDSEVHQVATLSSIIMPFLFPNLTYYEVGYFITDSILVSPDGIIGTDDTTLYAFEGKAPMGNKYTTPVHYEVPQRYITQTIFEQRATNSSQGTIYLSWSPESTSVFLVPKNDILCDTVVSELDSIYASRVLRRPSRLSEASKQIKEILAEMVTKCQFIGEFPSVHGVFREDQTNTDQSSPYYNPIPLHDYDHLSYDNILRHLYIGKEVLKESYDLQRQMASQVIVVLLADLDRLWKPEEPHAAPIMYFFRGYSLSMDIMRKLLESCKEACENHNIDVTVCSADGEFLNLMVKDKAGQPHTMNQLSKEIWSEISSLKKNQIISKLKCLSLQCIQEIEHRVSVGLDKKERPVVSISVHSKNGTFGKVRTSRKGWLVGKKETTRIEKETEFSEIETENDIMDTNEGLGDENQFADDIIDYALNMESSNTPEDKPDSEDALDLDTTILYNVNEYTASTDNTNSRQLTEVRLTQSDIGDIRHLLRLQNEKKWCQVSENDLSSYFKTADSLKKFIVKELIEITKFINIKPLMAKKQLKVVKVTKVDLVNQLSDLLCDGSKLEQKERKKRKKKVLSLKQLSENSILKKKYPKQALCIAYCESIWTERVFQWRTSSHVNEEVEIVGLNASFRPYYVPEFDEKSSKFQVFVYDKTHLGSNLRKAICVDKVHGISKQSWVKVADSFPDILNPTLLEVSEEGKILDQMKEQLARTMFSTEVENKMLENGDYKEAEFCGIIRNALYVADDEPGISALERCEKRIRLINWLDHDVHFEQFPPYGSHIKGLSQCLYEGLRSSQEAKLYLYAITKQKTYCVRAPNTLCSESFFSTMQEMDPWGQGVLSTTGVKKHITDFTTITAMKMSGERAFHIKTKRDSAYPTPQSETGGQSEQIINMECNCFENKFIKCIVPRDHLFDTEERARNTKEIKTFKFNTTDKPCRGDLPIRSQYGYKINERTVLPSKRLGIKIDT